MKKSRLSLLLLPCLLGACFAPRLTGIPFGDQVVVDGFRKRVQGPYPAAYRAQHRVTLSFYGRQFDFTGYLLVKRRGAWRAAAFGEFGGSLFELAAVPGKAVRVIKKPGAIRKSWLTGPAADLVELLFLPPAADAPVVVSKRGASVILAYLRKNGVQEEFRFAEEQGGEQAERFTVLRNGAAYEVEYSDYAAVPGVERKVPRHIVVENKKAQLKLEADLLKLEPGELPEKLFYE
ncbi:MAG TPA: hypothetical protein DCZ92_07765 [Elusimicrobia bacterium]|nr:MAG: hypothetical protein A2016_12860 [Elusimicrobia bacterium GWF2_62_30]HBA60703.1 hypothetical protein [Elusimicrobiota bacterium]